MRLLRTAVLAAVLSVSFAGLARAQYELTWDKCPGSMGAATNKMFACDDASPPMVLIAAFTPQKSLPRFAGVEFKFEIASATGDLPDWWKLGVGECREGGITTTNSPGMALGQCSNPWLGSLTGGGSQWETNFYGGGRSRFSMVYAREKVTALLPGTRYYGGSMTIESFGSSGGSCSGCNAEVCIAIREVIIAQEKDPNSPYDKPGSDDEIRVTNSSGTNIVSFNVRNPGANGCGSKVRNKTWGQVKSTYR